MMNDLIQVLVVDDEIQIQKILEIALRSQGISSCAVLNGLDAIELINKKAFQVVVLDLGLPDLDGREVLKKIRSVTQTPIIILSARSSEREKIDLFDMGANDYVTKPFSVNELMARIRAHIRVAQQLHPKSLTYDKYGLFIDFKTREVSVRNSPVYLTKKEFELLRLLIQHEGKIVTRSFLIKELWGPSYGENTHYLRILVAKLRGKLGDNAIEPSFIFTEPGIGLRFVSNTN